MSWGLAQTSRTGKTAALHASSANPQNGIGEKAWPPKAHVALILAPTRELCAPESGPPDQAYIGQVRT